MADGEGSALNHCVQIDVAGATVTTLADVLPSRGSLRMLFVGKAPAPASVEAGHHLQSTVGKGVWRRLAEANLLRTEPGQFGDDLLLEHGYGMTDLCKIPRPSGDEPDRAEYEVGWERVAGLVTCYRPRILAFVYKGSLDKVLRYSFGWEHKSGYGFNDDLMRTFGRRVFAFPLPGAACTVREANRHMADLVGALHIV